MKKVHKRILVCVVLVVVVFSIFTAINVNAFYNERVDDILVSDEDLYQSTYPEGDSKQAAYTSDLNNALMSNVYIHEYLTDSGRCMQIRFRITYALPFMHKDMWADTAPQVTDADGNVLHSELIVVSDTIAGFHGATYVLRFAGDDIPQSGETICFSFASKTAPETDKPPYASGTIEIEVGV